MKKVLFLGGAYAQIPIIKEAKNRGWYIITCDYLPDNPGHKLADESYNVSTTDFEGVLQLASEVKPDFVIAYASDPAATTAAWVSEKLGLPGNSYESVKLLSEKDLFRDFLANHGFNTPKMISLSGNQINYDNIRKLNFPLIVKPTDSSGSKGVSKIEKIEELLNAVEYALTFSRNKRIIAEEFIESDGAQLHGDGFVINRELVFIYLGDHHYNNSVNPFVPYSTSWPNTKPVQVISKVENELKRAISLSGFENGAINIEVRVTKSGEIYIMEIGPRSGGNFVPQVINYATDFDMVKATLDIYEQTKIEIKNKKERNTAYYVAHSEVEGVLKNIEIKEEIKPLIKEYHQYVNLGEHVKSFQGANAAIGVFLLQFDNPSQMKYYITNMNLFISIQTDKI